MRSDRVACLISFPEVTLRDTAVLQDAKPQTIDCSICGGNTIPAPEGTTERTRFTCRRCTARLARRRNEAEGRAFGVAESAREQYERNRLAVRRELIVD